MYVTAAVKKNTIAHLLYTHDLHLDKHGVQDVFDVRHALQEWDILRRGAGADNQQGGQHKARTRIAFSLSADDRRDDGAWFRDAHTFFFFFREAFFAFLPSHAQTPRPLNPASA